MRTLEQRRAEHALQRVRELEQRSDAFKKSYRAYVTRLGPTIVMSGLGQALATERASAGPNDNRTPDQAAHHAVYESLQAWLCGDGGVYPGEGDLLVAITENDERAYLRAQAEALAWLEWHKKFCRAYLPAQEGDVS